MCAGHGAGAREYGLGTAHFLRTRAETSLRKPVRGEVRRYPFRFRDTEDAEQRLVNLVHLTPRALSLPADEFDAAVDDAARVSDVVGRVVSDAVASVKR